MTGAPVLVLAHSCESGPDGAALIALVHWLAAFHRRHVTVIVWELGPQHHEVRQWTQIREIEALNRWPLAVALARRPISRPLARALRALRLRWWWRRIGSGPAVLRVGDLRMEMDHYQPPGAGPVVALRRDDQWRGLVAATARDLDRPADLRRSTVVAGWGHPDWRGGFDQFIQVAWWCHRTAAGAIDSFLWFLEDVEPDREVLADIERLGLEGAIRFVSVAGDLSLELRMMDAVIFCSRGQSWPTPVESDLVTELEAFGVTVVTPGTDDRAGVPHVDFGRPDDVAGALLAALACRPPAPTELVRPLLEARG